MRQPLSFDPIAEAADHWRAAGWADFTDGMALVTSIMRAQQLLLGRADELLAPFGLTFARFEVLMLLRFARAGKLPLGKVGQRLQVHPASVTNAIDRLERDGLVARQAHPTDRRTTLATLTPAGRRKSLRAAEALNEGLFASVGLDDQDARDVVGMLTALRRAAGDFA